MLAERARAHHREKYAKVIEHMRDIPSNQWLQELVKGELRFMDGLTKDKYMTYWLGYTFELEDPRNIKKLLEPLLHNKDERQAVEKAFAEVGLSLDEFEKTDWEELARTDRAAYNQYRFQLTRLTTPEHRVMPDVVASLPPEILSPEHHV